MGALRALILAAVVAVSGCQHDQYRDDALEAAGQKADYALDRATAWICSGRMSVRAIHDYMRRRNLTLEEFVAFCGWTPTEAAIVRHTPPASAP